MARILWVSSNGPRRAGDDSAPFIQQLARALRARGHDIELLLPHAPGLARSESIEDVPVTRYRYAWPESLETLCYGAGVLASLRARPARHALLPGLVAAQWRATAARLARGDVALVHAHWVLPQGFTAALAAQRARVPLVVTAHGSDLFGLRGGLSTAAKRHALERADAVTVNSSATEQEALALGAPRARLLRIPLGVADPAAVDAAAVAARRQALRRGNGPLLLFVGRLVPDKGADDLVAALARLRDTLPDATVALVGDGPERAALERQAAALGVAAQVQFVGAVPPAEVPVLLQVGDIFVAPSKPVTGQSREAQGLAMLEAMLAGRPVIAAATGGIPDAVRDGETGLLVPPGSPEAIAGAIVQLVRERFTMARAADAFGALYVRLMAAMRS